MTAPTADLVERSPEEFVQAFKVLQAEGIPEKHADLLRAHYAAPEHTATWKELADAVGYPSGNAVNLQYGTFAKRVALQLGIDSAPGFWLHVLADWAAQPGLHGHTAFRLRPAAVEALRRLGWASTMSLPSLLDTDDYALEGRQSLHLVAHRHREAALRRRRIAQARGESPDGKLRCSVPGCGFCFEDVYGREAEEYIQVHHTTWLSNPDRDPRTHLSDLALVCANCHAMLHYLEPLRDLADLIRHRDREVLTIV
jgi:predicted HNH restriction endonuclease